ncbi:MAG TPA: ChbG/HpnK family deacetylase [Candidatus Limnocylindria bacterium]|nr:ChbG/HpnK family deacetylase [Candidatus Limnocylindria bacterium]
MLAVTADDLGMSDGVTRGVLGAFQRGIVRSASLLVTYPGSEAAATAARAEAGLELGLHLDLVGGTPASDPASVRTLVDRDGRFLGLAAFVRALASGGIDPRELAREIRAQAARARSWGLALAAWDSHRHVHALPLVARVVGPVALEEGARWIRRPRPAGVWRGWKPLALTLSAAASEPFYRRLLGNDWYVDVSSWRPREAGAVAHLATLAGSGEIGAHPGYADDALRSVDTLVERREADLALLTDPALRTALGSAVGWRVPA